MATHSSILAWKIPWTEEPGGLQSMGSQKSRRRQSDAHTHTHTHPHPHTHTRSAELWGRIKAFGFGPGSQTSEPACLLELGALQAPRV